MPGVKKSFTKTYYMIKRQELCNKRERERERIDNTTCMCQINLWLAGRCRWRRYSSL